MGLKILLVADVDIDEVIGGAERVLQEEAIRLLKRDHEIYLLTRNGIPPKREEEVVKGIRVFRYNVNRSDPLLFIFTSTRNSKKLFERVNKIFKIDLINFHQPFSAFGVSLSKQSKNIKKLYTCHSLSFQEYISRNVEAKWPLKLLMKIYQNFIVTILKKIEKYSIGESDRIRVLSEFTARLLEENHGILKNRVTIISGGVDIERFSPKTDRENLRNKFNIPEKRFLLCTVRNLVPRMGIENLILSMKNIRARIPEAYLVIGGEGPLRFSLNQMVEENNLKDCIRIIGFIPEEDLPDFYRMADFFILPTRELEGFGLVTVEALSCGTPVLGTDVGATKEILEKFDKDFLFNGADEIYLAPKIIQKYEEFYNNIEKYKEIRARCRKFVEENYRWEKTIENLEGEFINLINQPAISHKL